MSCESFDDAFTLLQRYIKNSYSIESHSSKFSSLHHNFEKVKMAYNLFSEANLLPKNCNVHPKSFKESTNYREKGNKEFLQKKDLIAIGSYSISAAFAPSDSEELALAFANRSAVTSSLKEYTSCIEDIDRALDGKYPDSLRYKLYERKGKCLKCLGMNAAAKECFQTSIQVLSNAKLDDQKFQSVRLSLTKQLNTCSENDFIVKTEMKCLPCIQSKNETILSASSLLQVAYSNELGRHLVATANIEPGDVLVIEEPFASVLLPDSYTSHCFHCKKRCHSLIPCEFCVEAMFCSERCRSYSWTESHKTECTLVPLLVALGFTKLELIAVKTLLMATNQYKTLNRLLEVVAKLESVLSVEAKGFDNRGLYNSADYSTVHHLVGNLELRSQADIFRRSAIAAYILHLLHKNTAFLSSIGNSEESEQLSESKPEHLLHHKKFLVGGLLLQYLMVAPSNAHEISEMFIRHSERGEINCESLEIGGGLYPVLSLINHSCDPNVVRHSHNGSLNVLTAIQVIHAGEQIFDNYGYHHALHDLNTRQTKLAAQYHFKCQCRACKEDWPDYGQLPNTDPVYLNARLKEEVEKSSDVFRDVLAKVKSGDTEKKLGFLYAHLALLHRTIQRPWKEYSECQEAIKQCLSCQANHYFAQ